ncbi:Tn7 transposase TnsA N-terminal domain-containing protein [Photobacterium leiognathi]|uniref:Tn7 transposase TnsA N-terminal domain-containing protein n=1 Tax=Photobacterium leiognathi TaxID=553611 RepID=UPI0027365F11|nr:Tn7 transposase TnsA N-terminal domain-containing protein [Photobacterium leiognathi]
MYNRNLRKPHPNKNIYKFISVKNKTSIMCESGLENDACFLFEYNANVISYRSQPSGFEYLHEGKTCFYTPDFLVQYADLTTEYFEVKPFTRTIELEFKKKFRAIKSAAMQNEETISLITERQIHIQPRLGNAKLLHRYAGIQSPNSFQDKILDLLRIESSCTVSVGELVVRLKMSKGEVHSNLLALLSAGYIQANLLEHQFHQDTQIWVA